MSPTGPDWSDIDADDSSDASYFVNYLDTVTAQSEIQRYKRKTYQMLELGPGSRVLDIGCGTGDDVLAMAPLAGAHGAVVGVDSSATLIEEARARARRCRHRVDFHVGDAHALTFGDASFDGCRADRLLMHLADPAAAVAEMARVTRPGGRLVLREPDWDTIVVDSDDHEMTRRVLGAHFGRVIRHPQIGRALYRLLRQASLVDVEVADTSTLVLTDLAAADQLYGLADAAAALCRSAPELATRARAWLTGLRAADASGAFFSAVTGFAVMGRKPVA